MRAQPVVVPVLDRADRLPFEGSEGEFSPTGDAAGGLNINKLLTADKLARERSLLIQKRSGGRDCLRLITEFLQLDMVKSQNFNGLKNMPFL